MFRRDGDLELQFAGMRSCHFQACIGRGF